MGWTRLFSLSLPGPWISGTTLSCLDSIARVSSPFPGPYDAEHYGRFDEEPQQVAVEGRFDVHGPGEIFPVLNLLDDKLCTEPPPGY